MAKISISSIKKGDRIRVRAYGFGFSTFGWRTVTGKRRDTKGVYIYANGTREFGIAPHEITGHKPKNPTKAQRKGQLLALHSNLYSAADALRNDLDALDLEISDGTFATDEDAGREMDDVLGAIDELEEAIKSL